MELQKQYLIQPYTVGKNKSSLAMILPSDIVKKQNIDPLSVFFLLKVNGNDDLQLRIIRQQDLEKEKEVTPVEQASETFPQVSPLPAGV